MRQPIPIGEPDFGDSATASRFRHLGRWLAIPEYDPDKGTRAGDFQSPTHEYARRFAVSTTESEDNQVSVPGQGAPFIPREVEGVFLEPIPSSKRWRPIKIDNLEAFRAFSDSPNGRGKRMLEAFGDFDSDASERGGVDNTALINNEFVPLMAGPFCFTGDTKIPLLNGTESTIAELTRQYASGGTFWVYSVRPDGHIEPGLAHSPRRTGVQTHVLEVELDNGERVRCTPDHQWMLRDGTYRAARNLGVGDSLMPLYRKVSEKGLPGYTMVYQPDLNRFVYAHKSFTGRVKRGFIVHHDDLNKRNNNPDNLVVMGRGAHQQLHMTLGSSWWNDPVKRASAQAKISTRLTANNWTQRPEGKVARSEEMKSRYARGWTGGWRSLTQEQRDRRADRVRNSTLRAERTVRSNQNRVWTPEMRAKISASLKQRYARDPAMRENAQRAGMLGSAARWGVVKNHKVVSVRDAGVADVYDFTVEKHHNFALSLGVFVHNSKQLYIYDYLYMHARAFQLTNHNALAASAVKMLTNFTLGRGLSFHIKNPKCAAIWSEFWGRNKMRQRIRQAARDLTWQGELLWKYDEKQRGFLTLHNLDPSTCWEIVTDPEDIDHVYYYHFQWSTPYQIYIQGAIPVTRYIIKQVPPTNIQHLRINCSSQEKRGRSDLLPAMPWLKRFDDFYTGETLKKVLEANLVWKIKVKGDQQDVDAFLANPSLTQLPPPGGVWIENESVDLQAAQGQVGTGARGQSTIGDELGNIVAASLNLPGEYFNISGARGGAKATALVKTSPSVKMIEDRQQLFREEIEEMYDRVLSSALVARRLSKQDIHGDPESGPGDDDDPHAMTGSRADRVSLRRLDPRGDGQRAERTPIPR